MLITQSAHEHEVAVRLVLHGYFIGVLREAGFGNLPALVHLITVITEDVGAVIRCAISRQLGYS